ncbi:MAG: hypothetical protein HXY50_01250, partial [Ignavibacteriaceae bacterium]|nr:hypothetical protein [Ignavibacteriaceae bacterium]
MRIKTFYLLTTLLISFITYSFILMESTSTNLPKYQNSSVSIEERVDDLISRMTLEEKIDLLGGTGFETKAIERLGIPPLNMTDGPVGVRWKRSTAFPSGISMAST